MYDSWDMEHNGQNVLWFWTIFWPFTPPPPHPTPKIRNIFPTQKIKISKKWKNDWRYYLFTHVYNKWRSNDVWFLRCGVWQIFFVISDHFLPFYTPNCLKNQKNLKMRKNTWRYHHFTCVPKIMITWCWVSEIWCATERWTDGWTDVKSDILRWVAHLKMLLLAHLVTASSDWFKRSKLL